MSPTVLRVKGFRFYFFSREERRAHVHVQHADGEAKFWIDPAVELAANFSLRPKQVTEVQKLIEEPSMKSAAPGQSISPVEVTNVSPHGFWLFVGERELFVPFKEFPWFREASVREITNVQLPSSHHLYWPDLDIDLAVESIEHPEKYPLVSQAQPNKRLQPSKARRKPAPKRSAGRRLRG